MESSAFFRELVVVELASVLAGPAVGQFFAELGARVIKIENKRTGGDVTRHWRQKGEDANSPYSAYYCSTNWGKEQKLLDLRNPDEREAALALIAEADVLISNFKPASARKLGLDAETLRQRFPGVIYGQIHGFGRGDERPAFDVVLQAEAGFLHMCGYPDGPPAKMPVALIDLLAAHQLKEGILLALMERMRSGRGAYVEASLLESAVASLANQASNWLMNRINPGRMGTAHPNIAPYGSLFRCADGKEVVVAAGTEAQYQALCTALEAPELAGAPRFCTNALRVQHRTELEEALAPHFSRYSSADCLQRLNRAGVPAGQIRTLQEVFATPEGQAMVLEEQLADGTTARSVRQVAFRLSTDES
jgi:crotonobetainyl-CoA:carnitine CoA-transferase CaiB-like acyl-CoA transferase